MRTGVFDNNSTMCREYWVGGKIVASASIELLYSKRPDQLPVWMSAHLPFGSFPTPSKLIVINLLGGPGCGKSTIAAGLFSELKLRGHEAELVREYAKELIYEGKEHLLADQPPMFREHLRRISVLEGHVEFVVSDSPLLLSTIYCAETTSNEFKQEVVDHINRFHNINIVLQRPNRFSQAGRVHSLEQSKEIDEQVVAALERYKFKYTRVQTSPDAINNIIGVMKKVLGDEAIK